MAAMPLTRLCEGILKVACEGILKYTHVCRLRSWFKPHNPGLTAAEALTSPFFTYHYDDDFTPNI